MLWKLGVPPTVTTFVAFVPLELTGHKQTDKGEESKVGDSEYADDTAFLFGSRADCECQTPLIVKHFDRWGLQVHVGTGQNTKSKSEVLFVLRIQDVTQIVFLLMV